MTELLSFLAFVALIATIGGLFYFRPKLGGLKTAMPSISKIGGIAVIMALAGFLGWWFWGNISGLSFFWKLMLFVPFIILGWRLSKGLTFTLGSALLWFGMIGVTVIILLSNVGTVAVNGVNTAEEKIADVDIGSLFVGCPGSFTKGDTIVVRRGCTTELNSPNGTSFRAKDGAFDGMLTQYVDIEQPYAGYYTLKPNKGFPEGISEVEVTTIPPK